MSLADRLSTGWHHYGMFLPQLLDDEQLEAIRRDFLGVADEIGIPLIAIPSYESPGVTFEYLPVERDWPSVHVSLMLFNWRIQQLDSPLSYFRHWCYAGVDMLTFVTVLRHLEQWAGDPADEPCGWTKRHTNPDVRVGLRRIRAADRFTWDNVEQIPGM